MGKVHINLNLYMPNINGIIHVGAHTGEEFHFYKEHGLKNLILVEPDQKCHQILESMIEESREQFEYLTLIRAAAGPQNQREASLYVETTLAGGALGGRSSILRPSINYFGGTGRYNFITFDQSQQTVPMIRLDHLPFPEDILFNCLNIDVQGYELGVLQGATNLLEAIDYIVCEVNKVQLYEGGALVQDIDNFLAPYGFRRIETNWIDSEGQWGDAFYIKERAR